jgi:hypothetical protein
VFLPVAEIKEVRDQVVCVVFEKTQKAAWLPLREVDFMPGHIVMPIWLARKIGVLQNG